MSSKNVPDEPLPAAIGRPALRALTSAGIHSLGDVATRTDKQLASLHGVGPKAIRILRETLKARRPEDSTSGRARRG